MKRLMDGTYYNIAQMVDRLFAGSPEEMVTALMEYRGLSADEADRIRAMIDEAENKSLTQPTLKARKKRGGQS